MQMSELLDRAKEAQQIKSDRQLALKIGVSHTAVGKWRAEVDLPSIPHAITLAKMANLDPDEILIDVQIQGAENEEVFDTLCSIKHKLIAYYLLAGAVVQCILC